MSKVLIGLCALVLLVVTPSVKADPLTVTGGSLSLVGSFGNPHYTFTGENFSITAVGERGNSQPQSCFACVNGSLLGVNSFFAGRSLGLGTATIDGTTFPDLFFTGTLTFIGDPVLVPAATTNVTLTSAFTFSGNVFGCLLEESPDCGESNSVFSAQLVGQGIVTINLNFFGVNASGQSVFFLRDVTYEFTEVPEPLTIILLTSGLMSLGAKLKWSSQRRSRG